MKHIDNEMHILKLFNLGNDIVDDMPRAISKGRQARREYVELDGNF